MPRASIFTNFITRRSESNLSWKPLCSRNINYSFPEAIKNIRHVKTEDLGSIPYRLGVVNDTIWLRIAEVTLSSNFAVYDKYLNRIREFSWPYIPQANMAQQISQNEVIVVGWGLHVVDIEGKYLYKIKDGLFSDVCINGTEVAAMECNKNQIIFFRKRFGRWRKHYKINFYDPDIDIKTMQFRLGNVFVAVHWSDRVLKLNADTGELLHCYGNTDGSSTLGEFNGPNICAVDSFQRLIVCDSMNSCFQYFDQQCRWQDIRLPGVTSIRDMVVFENNFFILHGDKDMDMEFCQLSKYTMTD